MKWIVSISLDKMLWEDHFGAISGRRTKKGIILATRMKKSAV